MKAIYDRTLLDIERVKELTKKAYTSGFDSFTETEKQEWYAGLKGTLNCTDLNRIEGNCKSLADFLDLNVDVRTDWQMTDFPSVSDFERITQNVKTIRDSRFFYSETPNVPALPINIYTKVNDIEKILWDAFELYYNGRRMLTFNLGKMEGF